MSRKIAATADEQKKLEEKRFAARQNKNKKELDDGKNKTFRWADY